MSDPIFVVLVAAIGGLFGSCLHLSLGWRSGFVISCGSIAFIAGLASKVAEVSALSAATGVVLACVVVLVYGVHYKHAFAMTVVSSPQLSQFGLHNFDRLDVDKDGLITLFDLWDAAELPANSREDLIMIRLLERQLARVGHVIDTSIVVSPMSTGVVTVDHHGISVDDLENYPNKIRTLYEQQFGEKLS